MKTIILILIISLSSLSHANERTQLTDWIIKNRTELDSLTTQEAKLKIKNFLSNKLDAIKFVHLGTPEHHVHEKWQYHLLFMETLFDMGFTNIIHQFGRSDGKKINNYLKTGDNEYLNSVCVFGYCKGGDNGKDPYYQEEMNFFKQLRSISEKIDRPIKHIGFDFDNNTIAPINEIKKKISVLSESSNKIVSKESYKLLKAIDFNTDTTPFEKVTLSQTLINSFIANSDLFKNEVGVSTYNDLLVDIKALYSTLDTHYRYRLNYPDKESQQQNTYQVYVKREQKVIERLRYDLSKANKDDKYIVLAHNSHLQKQHFGFRVSRPGIDDSPLWPTLGEWIEETFPSQTYMIWLGIGEGKYHGHCKTEPLCKAGPVEGTIEESFLKISTKPWISEISNSTPLESKVYFSDSMVYKGSGDLKSAIDAYFFIPKVTEPINH